MAVRRRGRGCGSEGLIYKEFALTPADRSEIIAARSTVSGLSGLIVLRAFRTQLVVALLALSFGGNALAWITRLIPADAKPMVMIFSGGTAVKIKADSFFKKDIVLTLSPGLQIRDAGNGLVPSTHVQGEYKVRAQIDNIGQVHRVWILTPAEIAAINSQQ